MRFKARNQYIGAFFAFLGVVSLMEIFCNMIKEKKKLLPSMFMKNQSNVEEKNPNT